MNRIFVNLLLTTLIFCSTTICKSETPQDSLTFQLSEIVFKDSLEKELFSNIIKGETNFLKLFYVSCNPNFDEKEFSEFKKSIDDLENHLIDKNITSKNEKKKIKLIHGEIHDQFFKKYEEIIDFYKLVEKGTYNCVTGSALFAIMLDKFKIPYSIKESPQHVFILAYPNSHKIPLESTDPLKGYKAYKDDYKTMFVQSLWKNKLISDSEYKAGNTDELFEKYFFPEENLGLKELLAIHYLNNAIELATKEFYDDAFEQIKKAYLLFPSEKTFLILFQMNIAVLENVTYEKNEDLKNLLFLTKFIDKGITSDDIQNEFIKITYNNLVEQYNPEHYEKIYYEFHSGLQDEDLKKKIEYIYNYERGRVYLNKGRYKESLEFTEKAFMLNPENSDAQINYISSLAQRLTLNGFIQSDLDKTEKISEDYPAILLNNNFIRLKGFYYALGAEQAFKDKNVNSGISLIEKLESLTDSYASVKIDENIIGRAFSEAAVYYFKAGNASKAKSLIRKGLLLAPDSQELNTRKIMLEY